MRTSYKGRGQSGVGLILSLAGAAGTGKSTAARYLVNLGWHRIKFASPIKSMLKGYLEYCGYDKTTIIDFLEDSAKDTKLDELANHTPRETLASLANDWCRSFLGKEFLSDLVQRNIRALSCTGSNVIVDDLRLTHEYRSIKRSGGYVVKIVRSTQICDKNFDVFHCDYIIENSGSIKELHKSIDNVVSLIRTQNT